MIKYKHQQKRLKNAYDEINIWANYIKHTDIIFDIGTNIGLYTIAFSKKFPNSKIHSFDPMVSLVEDMWNENIKNYNISNAKFYEFGFSNVEGELEFRMPKHDDLDEIEVHSYKLNDSFGYNPLIGRVCRLDSFVEEYKIKPDVIKIDAEGAELDIINGGLDIILSANTLIIEMPDKKHHGFRFNNTNTIHDILIKNNFKHIDTTAKFNRIYTK